jgi:drug/metabolite transporter superfamily protein YnfA
MKKRTWWILIVLVALLVSGVMLTQTALASRETATGGVYHLTTLTWQVSGSSGADGYRLQSYSQRDLTGNGCCCLFLPCIKR